LPHLCRQPSVPSRATLTMQWYLCDACVVRISSLVHGRLLLRICGLLLSDFGGVGCDGRLEDANGTCSRARAQSNLARPVDFRKVRGSRFSLGTARNQFLHRRCDRNNTRLSVQKPIIFLAIVWLTVERTEASTGRERMYVGAYNLTSHTDSSAVFEH
jgi:hypothetical protein